MNRYGDSINTGKASQQKKKAALYWGCGCTVVVAIIIIIALGFGGLQFYRIFRGPVDVIKAHYQALDADDYEEAYAYFSSDFQSKNSFTDYKRIVQRHPEMFEIKRSSFRSVNITNDRATVGAKIWAKNGMVNYLVFELQQVKGEWKIDSFKILEQEEKKGFSI